ncbi:hypothetical protein [Anaeromyxobacter paludicola]|uniref:Uncharacterized protein n=1 Tax=Anaeromyxobacter paludicola TaxID=2918171 RepID=A0ABM7XFZ3_9BACT|nr:hypothetical protein [Anaeromyxobacter paludicola]BDG10796.1 hypothetical protein AMPC_39090 [Anaeromyxobacter paludicola]
MNHKRLVRSLCLLLGLSLALPAAGGDLKDSADQAEHDTRKAVRQHKPGGEDLGDRVEDAKDSAASHRDKARKKGRKGKSKLRKDIHSER